MRIFFLDKTHSNKIQHDFRRQKGEKMLLQYNCLSKTTNKVSVTLLFNHKKIQNKEYLGLDGVHQNTKIFTF